MKNAMQLKGIIKNMAAKSGVKANLLFEDRKIEILAYNLESVLAEKFETIISRSILNTRARDYYDIFILTKLQTKNINKDDFKKALEATATKRGT